MSSFICSGPNSRRCLPARSSGRSNGVPFSSLFVYVPSILGSPHEVRGSFGAVAAVCAGAFVLAAARAVKARAARVRVSMTLS